MAIADHLQVPRQHGLFTHHGIDLGDGTVAHYLEGREILRSTLQDFLQNQTFTIINYSKSDSIGVTLRRAMSRIGEQNYNLLFNNCEHFAIWCKTGRHRSSQVESVLESTRKLRQMMPSKLLSALALLLEYGLLDQKRRKIALKGLARLEQLRIKLIGNMETLLLRVNEDKSNYSLINKGQILADELATIEELKQKIHDLLYNTTALAQSDASK